MASHCAAPVVRCSTKECRPSGPSTASGHAWQAACAYPAASVACTPARSLFLERSRFMALVRRYPRTVAVVLSILASALLVSAFAPAVLGQASRPDTIVPLD